MPEGKGRGTASGGNASGRRTRPARSAKGLRQARGRRTRRGRRGGRRRTGGRRVSGTGGTRGPAELVAGNLGTSAACAAALKTAGDGGRKRGIGGKFGGAGPVSGRRLRSRTNGSGGRGTETPDEACCDLLGENEGRRKRAGFGAEAGSGGEGGAVGGRGHGNGYERSIHPGAQAAREGGEVAAGGKTRKNLRPVERRERWRERGDEVVPDEDGVEDAVVGPRRRPAPAGPEKEQHANVECDESGDAPVGGAEENGGRKPLALPGPPGSEQETETAARGRERVGDETPEQGLGGAEALAGRVDHGGGKEPPGPGTRTRVGDALNGAGENESRQGGAEDAEGPAVEAEQVCGEQNGPDRQKREDEVAQGCEETWRERQYLHGRKNRDRGER